MQSQKFLVQLGKAYPEPGGYVKDELIKAWAIASFDERRSVDLGQEARSGISTDDLVASLLDELEPAYVVDRFGSTLRPDQYLNSDSADRGSTKGLTRRGTSMFALHGPEMSITTTITTRKQLMKQADPLVEVVALSLKLAKLLRESAGTLLDLFQSRGETFMFRPRRLRQSS